MFNYHTDIELKEAKASFPKAYVGTYGELRWKSNDRVPMEDMLGFWVELGLIDEDTKKLSNLAREEEDKEFLSRYRAQQANRQVTAEEAYEMRAAFGPGVNVVDVITGRKYRT